MTITYPLSLPNTTDIRFVTLRGKSVVAISRSPFNFKEQVFAFPADAWAGDITLRKMARAAAETWISFLLKLNGVEGTFLLGDPNAASPRGTPTGTPQVDGAAQTGKVLATKGWTNNSTGNLLEGDYIQLGTGATSRLHKVLTASVDADGSGLVSIDIWPRLRASPADSATITTSNCVGVFRLASSMAEWDIDEAQHYETGFSIVESI